MTKEDIYTEINDLFTQFRQCHYSTKKKDAVAARKALGSIKKLVTGYNRASVEEAKSIKST